MTILFLVLGIGFWIAYLFMLIRSLFKKKEAAIVENMTERKTAGKFFYGALFSFLIFIYLLTRNILWTILAIPLIFLIQIIFQIVSGAIVRAAWKKP